MSTEAWRMQTEGWHPDCDISPRSAAILQAAATIYAAALTNRHTAPAVCALGPCPADDQAIRWALRAAEWLEFQCRNVGADDEDGEA